MSEIEKMYENAGVLKECLSPCYINKTWRKTHDCPNCDNRENYPPFTAEKQTEIIKKLWEFRPNIYPDFDLLVNHSFGEMIATFINNLWQDLTDVEKEQIKEILKG